MTNLVVFTNELEVDAKGWAQIAPWGDHPAVATEIQPDGSYRRFRAIQRIDRTAATEMVNHCGRRVGRGFAVGLDIFEGHPDAPVIGDRWANKSPVGTVAEVQVRKDGLYGRPIFNPAGAQLIEGGRKLGMSGRWTAQCVGEENGVRVYRPDMLKSVGVTPNPNLPVEMLNECDLAGVDPSTQPQNNIMNKTAIIAALKGCGVELANEATDEQIEQGLAKLGAVLKGVPAIEQARDTAQARATELANERDALKEQVASLTGERDSARVQFTNERTARKGLILDAAQRDGRLTPADRPSWETKLETDFANASDELAKRKPTVKTTPVTDAAGSRKVELANCTSFGEVVTHFVNSGKPKSAAVDEAIKAAPDLYAEYRKTGGQF